MFLNGLSIRGGTDPAFVRAQSSAPEIVAPVIPDFLISDGTVTGILNFAILGVGEAILSASQPDGFISVTDSSIAVQIF